MSFKPWKKPLLATFVVATTYSAATAQNIQNAQRAIELGRYNEARAILNPGSTPETAFEMGRLYQFRDMPDSAAFFFNKAASQSPMGMIATGRALLAKGQNDAAEAQFAAAAKATKNKDASILAAISKAYAEAEVKDISKAKSYLEAAQVANKAKDDAGLMVTRGDVFLLTDQGGGEAMSSYDRAIRANPSYTQAYYRKGVLNVRSRNFNEAQTNLQKAVDLDPSYAPAYRELADMYYYAGKYDLALSNFQKYIGLAEKSSRTDAQYASFLYLTKKFPEALTEANKVLSTEPNNQTMNRIKAYSLYETGDYAGASAAMDTYLKVTPADKIIADDYAYQGRILAKTGKYAEAAAAIDKAIAADPTKEGELQIDRANIYVAQGDFKKAGDVYQKRLKSGKGDLTDQFRYAGVLGSAKQYVQADSVYNIILTEKPTYAPGYLYRGRVNVNRDLDSKQGLAKPYYEKYIELAKDPAADPAKFRDGLVEANSYLGYYNLQKGDKAAALPYYEQVLALDPTNANANKAVDIIKGKTATPTKKAPVAPAKKK
jgi:tetratricopeptide (TPR) repeat protein